MGNHVGKTGAVFLRESSWARHSSCESCLPSLQSLYIGRVSVDRYLSLRFSPGPQFSRASKHLMPYRTYIDRV